MKAILLILSGVGLLFALSVGYDMYAGPQFTPVSDHKESAIYDLSLGTDSPLCKRLGLQP